MKSSLWPLDFVPCFQEAKDCFCALVSACPKACWWWSIWVPLLFWQKDLFQDWRVISWNLMKRICLFLGQIVKGHADGFSVPGKPLFQDSVVWLQDLVLMIFLCFQVVSKQLNQKRLHNLFYCLFWSLGQLHICQFQNLIHHILLEQVRQYVLRKRWFYIPVNFIGAIDGLIIQQEWSGNENWQHTNKNGKSCTAAKILVIQLFDGTYGPSVLNYIGSAHDSKLASLLNINMLLAHLHPTFMLCADSAFRTSSQVVCPLTEREMQSLNWVRWQLHHL